MYAFAAGGGSNESPVSPSVFVSKVWAADQGDGNYKNPVLYADYSDPDVIRVGNDYYMTASSFTCFPGLPILHSKDLVNWTLIGHAVSRYPNPDFNVPQHGKGIWAPSIRFQDGMFYIFWGDPDNGIYRVRSVRPEGPWEEPLLILPGKGLIDPCPLWDDNGKAWLVHAWAGSRAGVKSLLTLREMDWQATQVSRDARHIFDGHEKHPTIEGPKFYKHDGYYYIFAPGGGVTSGWQVVLRSKDIYGPYEDRIVLHQGSAPVNGPHQGGWVQTPSGQSWFLHFQDAGPYGRIIHLQPVVWKEGWPVMGTDPDGDGTGEPVLSWKKPDVGGVFPKMTPADSDEFDGDTLGLQWQWQANPNPAWFAKVRGTDYLRLFAVPLPAPEANFWQVPNLLLQKFPAPDFTASAKVRLVPEQQNIRGGLVVFGDDYSALELAVREGAKVLRLVVCMQAETGSREGLAAEIPAQTDTLILRVQVSSPNALCQFSYSLDGKEFVPAGRPFPAKPGRWVGAKVGLYCVSQAGSRAGGYLDVDWFRVE
ncbi:MAG TPA: glycoside hydrolase 43 family protein [Anaerohalosphaeraceae bacterium]|nr:glycoside hydrolase 43 family protein [Anaerohalosphaeraceae bacterium]